MPKTKINETLFGKLITSLGLKIKDLEEYFDVSKTTIRNYRMKDNLDAIPQEKHEDVFYLFGVKNIQELKTLANGKKTTKLKNEISTRLTEGKKDIVKTEDSLMTMYFTLIEKKVDVLKAKIKNEAQALQLLNELTKLNL